MPYRRYILLILFFLPFGSIAQDITGLWKGTLYNDTTGLYYRYEIGISKEKRGYSGFSHTWFLVDDQQYYGVKKVKVKVGAEGKILVEDDGLIANNYPMAPNKGVRQLNVLTLDASDSLMTLTGPFSTNRTREFHPLTGYIKLERKNDFWQSSLIPHLQELGKAEDLSFVKEEIAAEALAVKQAADKKLKEEKALAEANATQALIAKEKANKQQAEEKRSADTKAQQDVMAKQAADKKIAEEQAIAEAKLKADKDAMAKQLADRTKTEEKMRAAQKQEADRKQAEEKATAAAKIKTEQVAIARQNTYRKLAEEKAMAEVKGGNAQVVAKVKADQKPAEENPIATPPPTSTEIKTKAVAPVVAQAATQVAQRKNVVQQTVSFSTDSLQLALYDNGEVDGDTVSVLMNGSLILARQGLSTNAIRHTIYIPKNLDQVELVMYAETLGSIPPNTGLLVIRDGKKLYEIRFSGDMQKNASIIFNRVKD